MDSKDKRHGWDRWLQCFGFALSGLIQAIKTEKNLKIHLAAAVAVIIFMLVFHLSYIEDLILIVVIGIVISLELVNTAIEHTVNLITEEYHPLAKLAKDTAAGAVLFFSVISVVIALIIFFHHL